MSLENLIEIIRSKPCLYDKQNPKYKDNVYKEQLWEEIGREINLQAKECKIKWKSLRDRFRKEKLNENAPSGSAAKAKKTWQFKESLEFLSDTLKPANTTGNVGNELDDSVEWLIDEESSTSFSRPSNSKRKNDEMLNDVLLAMKRKYENPVQQKHDHFIAMLCSKFDKLPEEEVDDVQLEILQMVNTKINMRRTH